MALWSELAKTSRSFLIPSVGQLNPFTGLTYLESMGRKEEMTRPIERIVFWPRYTMGGKIQSALEQLNEWLEYKDVEIVSICEHVLPVATSITLYFRWN